MNEHELWYPAYETVETYSEDGISLEREYSGVIRNDALGEMVRVDYEDDAEDECNLRNAAITKEAGL